MKEVQKVTIGYRIQKTCGDEFIATPLSRNSPMVVVKNLDDVLDIFKDQVSEEIDEHETGCIFKAKIEITKYQTEDENETLFDIEREEESI